MRVETVSTRSDDHPGPWDNSLAIRNMQYTQQGLMRLADKIDDQLSRIGGRTYTWGSEHSIDTFAAKIVAYAEHSSNTQDGDPDGDQEHPHTRTGN